MIKSYLFSIILHFNFTFVIAQWDDYEPEEEDPGKRHWDIRLTANV